VTATMIVVAAGDIVQKILRPLITQPSAVRSARVDGRSRSWPGSLTPAAMTSRLCDQHQHGPRPNVAARRPSPVAIAIR